ncbi:MAG: gliding motility-associated C-terminal domain-containing protein [Chitinophagia bacterium]|nr:gliding motility-associated C-terminal domain-containing protein [Chitinophagia bacterium]
MNKFSHWLFGMLLLTATSLVLSQESYDKCSDALVLCPENQIPINNFNATSNFVGEDMFEPLLGFKQTNTIWLTFTTSSLGGDAQLVFSNLLFKTTLPTSAFHIGLVQAGVECNADTYSKIAVKKNVSSDFTVDAFGLPPKTKYYLVLTGANVTTPEEFKIDVLLKGSGIDRPAPSIKLVQPSQQLCTKTPTKFNVETLNCIDSSQFQWFVNDVLQANTDSAFFETASLKSGDVLKVKTTCYSSTTCPINIQASSAVLNVISFNVDAGPDQLIEEGQITALNGATDAEGYYWTPKIGIEDEYLLTTSTSPNQTITYFLVGTKQGCTLSDPVVIKVKRKELIPVNSFTPNADGINDTWEVPFLEDFPNCSVKIINRWGHTVFETTGYNYKKYWDGSINGIPVDEGVLFYVISLRDPFYTEPLRGTLTIVR